MRSAIALLLAIPMAVAQSVIPARAGLLYHAYGGLRADGEPVTQSFTPRDSQRVATGDGRAEFLLGSGAVLWLDSFSELRFDSTSLDDVRVNLLAGRAIVEIVKLPEIARITIGADPLQRGGVYTYGSPSPAFHRWAALRSYRLFLDRGRKPENWQRVEGGRLVRNEGFHRDFPPNSPHLFYAIDHRAGLLSYTESDASIHAPAYLGLNAPFSTGEAPAEMFLGRGITLRLAPQSAMRLIDGDPSHPEFVLERGLAMLEIAESARRIPLQAHVGNALIEPTSNGLYLLDHAAESLLVYEGEARVSAYDRRVSARSAQRLNLSTPTAPARFDTKQHGEFFRWCGFRSLLLDYAGGGLLGDWKPPIRRLVWHKHFGTQIQYDSQIRGADDLENALRAALQQAPF